MPRSYIQKVAPYVVPALKLAACFGITLASGAFGQDELAKGLTDGQEAEIAALIKSGLDLVKTLGGNGVGGSTGELVEKYRLTINGDFEGAFHDAIIDALTTIESNYYKQYPDASTQPATIAPFFTELKKILVQTPVSEDDVKLYVVDRQHFLHHARNLEALDGADYALPEKLFVFITEHFGHTLQHELLKQLKSNAKAQTAYVISLLELNIRYGANNAEALEALQKNIWELITIVTTMREQSANIVKLLLLIQQEQYKLAIDTRLNFQRMLDELRKNKQQPKLYDYSTIGPSNAKSDRYHYRTAFTTFIGREAEITQLEKFVLPDPQARFRWWVVTGPGGIGKSRLAQELCRTFNEFGTYYAGFLADGQERESNRSHWQNWQPERHTLIILDYVSTRAEDVRDIIADLTNRVNELAYSVRLLLLERTIDGPWWQTINTNETRASWFRSAESTLAVTAFTDDDRWRIIKEVHRKVTEEHRLRNEQLPKNLWEKTETLKKLKELDPFDRPLFSFFVGIALSDGETIRHWDIHDLLNHILKEHERKRWWNKVPKNEEQRQYERLLALATITRGLSLAHWRGVVKVVEGLPNPVGYDRAVLDRMSGFTQTTLSPLEPDILGEFFVADILTDWQTFHDDGTNVGRLIGQAWQIAPENTWAFAERLLFDFPKTLCLPYFWEDLPDIITTEPIKLETAIAWSSFQLNLTHDTLMYCREDLIDSTLRYKQVVKLRTEYGFDLNAEIALGQANVAMNLTISLGEDKQLVKAQMYYETIVDLRREHAFIADIQIALAQANAANNLASYLGEDKQFDKAQTYYDAITELRREHAFIADIQIALAQAKAAYNLTKHLGVNKHFIKAQMYYVDIVKLRKNHEFRTDIQIALRQAMAATNLTKYLGEDKQLVKAQTYYEAIIKLRRKYGFEADAQIALQQAMAASNLMIGFGLDREQFMKALKYYNKVTELVLKFGSDQYLFSRLARTSRTLLLLVMEWRQYQWIELKKANELINVPYKNLQRLYQSINDPTVHIEYGKAIYIFKSQSDLGYPQELVNQWIKVIKALLAEHSKYDDPEWQELIPGFVKWVSNIDMDTTQNETES